MLPTKRTAWEQAAKDNKIQPLQLLADGDEIPSASKFKFDHFLRLRILYIEAQPPKLLAASDGFPTKGFKKMKDLLDKDPNACFLKEFLRKEENIKADWNRDSIDKSGKFAMPLEHLHLIAKRSPAEMEDDQDLGDNKIVWSPLKTRAASKSDALSLGGSPSTPSHRRMLAQGKEDYDTSPNSSDDTFGLSDLSMESLEEPVSPVSPVSPPNTDVRRATDDYDRSDFSQGDEQTVNATLVDFMIALSWLLGFTGRILHDREKYVIPKDDKTHLYSASVDGLIRHLNDDTINGFMEVKGNLRGLNQPVRRQIGAQMAAFVYHQDIQFSKSKVGTVVKTLFKPQGKQAKNKGNKAKGEEVEDQKKKK